MRDELPPPVITIRDPNAPSPLSDVIGGRDDDELPGRQWSWRDRGLAAMVVAVIATTGAGVWGVEHLHDEQRLDKASVTELDLNAVSADDSDFSFDTIAVTLANDGPHPVSVLSARVKGSAPVPTVTARRNTLKPNATETVRFRRPACPESLPDIEGSTFGFESGELELTVRTYRGQTSTVSLSGQDAVSRLVSGYYYTMVEHCRLYPPATSLVQSSPIRTVRKGKDLVVTVSVRNRAKKPRTLHELSVNGGLTLLAGTRDLDFEGGATHDVSLTLRATDCRAALLSWATSFDELSAQPSDLAGYRPGIVRTAVYGDGQPDAEGLLLGAGFSGTGIGPWVRAVCPKA